MLRAKCVCGPRPPTPSMLLCFHPSLLTKHKCKVKPPTIQEPQGRTVNCKFSGCRFGAVTRATQTKAGSEAPGQSRALPPVLSFSLGPLVTHGARDLRRDIKGLLSHPRHSSYPPSGPERGWHRRTGRAFLPRSTKLDHSLPKAGCILSEHSGLLHIQVEAITESQD